MKYKMTFEVIDKFDNLIDKKTFKEEYKGNLLKLCKQMVEDEGTMGWYDGELKLIKAEFIAKQPKQKSTGKEKCYCKGFEMVRDRIKCPVCKGTNIAFKMNKGDGTATKVKCPMCSGKYSRPTLQPIEKIIKFNHDDRFSFLSYQGGVVLADKINELCDRINLLSIKIKE